MSKDIKKLVYSLHPLEKKVLTEIDSSDIEIISKKVGLSEEDTLKAMLLLEQKNFVKLNKEESKVVSLDVFGEKYLNSDLPEITILKELASSEKKASELSVSSEELSSSLGILKRNKLVEVRKEDELILKSNETAKNYIKDYKNNLSLFKTPKKISDLSELEKKTLEEFKFRKSFLKEITIKTISVELTKEGLTLAKELKENYKDLELLDALDSSIIKSGSWKGKEFRHYDISLEVPQENNIGRRHPMLEANDILKDVFVEMGFKEMQGPMVEIAFWNMDTMWIPQDHPARDEQDTFYLEGEGIANEKLLSKVKEMHEVGIKKTHTALGEWSKETSLRRLLRTHSTATTFRTLAKLGESLKKGENVNGKYFYVANNFRNEAVDATHLAEFYQAEGFIIGDDLSLADLMGFIKDYYKKLGIDKIKFKPTFNPYTEPSMEAHYFDEKMNKWYALINSGIFRPETLKPLGLENKTIIAWGMGASRVATLLANVESMRDITGATCDIGWLKSRPMMKREIVRK